MSTPSFRALVVDDESIVRMTVAMALKQEDFDCETAIDGVDALQKISQHTFDLLITDLQMPKKHGCALAFEVLKLNAVPVIVVHSSIDNPQLIKDLITRGVEDVVCKPTNYATLAAKLNGLVQRYHSARGHAGQRLTNRFTDDLIEARSLSSTQPLQMSPIAIELLMLLKNNEPDAKSLSVAIAKDSILAAILIKAANSSTGLVVRRTISSLEEAIARIGTNRAMEIINKYTPNPAAT